MHKKLIMGLLISSMILGISLNTVAKSDGDQVIVYQIKDENVEGVLMNVDIHVQNVEEKIINIFEFLTALDYNENQIQLIPEEAAINFCMFNDGHIDVVFNEQLGNYGGSTHEFFMVNQLLALAFAVEEVKTVSFYIEDRDTFTEGTHINNYTQEQFIERMKQSESY